MKLHTLPIASKILLLIPNCQNNSNYPLITKTYLKKPLYQISRQYMDVGNFFPSPIRHHNAFKIFITVATTTAASKSHIANTNTNKAGVHVIPILIAKRWTYFKYKARRLGLLLLVSCTQVTKGGGFISSSGSPTPIYLAKKRYLPHTTTHDRQNDKNCSLVTKTDLK